MIVNLVLLLSALKFCLAQNFTVPFSQYTALAELYNSTNGVHWKWKHANYFGLQWFTTDSPCNSSAISIWQGLTCSCDAKNETCGIVQMELIDFNMTGSIPGSIGNLANLTVLKLSNSLITGTLPSDIGNLVNLTILSFENNTMMGSLPDTFFLLTNIVDLYLGMNNFTGSLSDEIGNMQQLEVFSLNRNEFNGEIPASLFEIFNISLIDFAGNQFNSTIPDTIGQAYNLLQLDLSRNSLFGSIPVGFGNLSGLHYLDLAKNDLTGNIPEDIYHCSNLVKLSLSLNNLNGTISDSISNLTKLNQIAFDNNALTGTIPASIGSLKRLSIVYLNNLLLTGTIPYSIFERSDIREFQVYNNFLTGTISSSIANGRFLRTLLLHDNYFNGTLPSEISSLSYLFRLALNNNYFTGSIPKEWGSLTSLHELFLNNNYLNGSIPSELFDCTSLFTVSVSFNELIGTLSSSIAQLTSITSFSVASNKLSGTLPSTLYSMPVKDLYLYSNYFNGSISEDIGNMQSITLFEFYENDFTGSLPNNISNLNNLAAIAGYNNKLTGSIPQSICLCNHLASVYFQSNYLSSSIPQCIFKAVGATEITLFSNMFTGTIPGNISYAFVTKLLISDNYLSGSIPTIMNTRIQYFELNNNQFTGTIASSLFVTGSYVQIILNSNYLTGSIPTNIGTVGDISWLDLYQNLLTGTLPVSIGEMESLSLLYVDTNILSGSLACFDNGKTSFLTEVEVSFNQFIGTIPKSVFSIPTLQTFAAISNCFTGSISADYCNATELVVLDLDGIHTSPACRHELFGGNYALNYFTPGSIPTCLFNMPKLTTLHLSGNGIGGSLPYHMPVNTNLTDLALSYNQLTGSIPFLLQENYFINFDLSYNNFNGVLLPFSIAYPLNGSAYLQVNRLSGEIPLLFKNMLNVAVLDNNMFECDWDRSQLPTHDSKSLNYVCGTTYLQVSLYTFAVCFGLVGCLLSTLILLNHYLVFSKDEFIGWAASLWSKLESWLFVFYCDDQGIFGNIALFGQFARNLRLFYLLMTIFIVIVVLPINLGLSANFPMFQYKYAWNVSVVFLHGFKPAITMMVGYLSFLILLFYMIYRICAKYLSVDLVGGTQRETVVEIVKKRYKQWLGLCAIACCNFFIVLIVNMAFVYISINFGRLAVTLSEIALAVFKLVWNDSVIREMTKWMHRYFNNGAVLSIAEERAWHGRYLSFNTSTLIFNIIVIPCIATAAVSTECLFNIFIKPSQVSSDITFTPCTEFTTIQHFPEILNPNCTSYAVETFSTSFLPPYIYRYQCASTLVTTYTIVFVYKFLFAAFVQPIIMIFIVWLSDRQELDSELNKLLVTYMPYVVHRITWTQRRRKVLSADRFNLKMIMYLSVFVTYGVFFPPLAVMICVAAYATTLFIQLSVGRLICFSTNKAEKKTLLLYLNHDCANAGAMFKSSIYVIGPAAACFYAFMIFDTYGDEVGGKEALKMAIPMFLIGWTIVLIFRVIISRSNINKEDDRDSILSGKMGVHIRKSAMSESSGRGSNESYGRSGTITNPVHDDQL